MRLQQVLNTEGGFYSYINTSCISIKVTKCVNVIQKNYLGIEYIFKKILRQYLLITLCSSIQFMRITKAHCADSTNMSYCLPSRKDWKINDGFSIKLPNGPIMPVNVYVWDFNPLLPKFFFCRFMPIIRLTLFVYRLIVATLIGFYFFDPF